MERKRIYEEFRSSLRRPLKTDVSYRRIVATAADVARILVGADYDDAYVAWVNGVEIERSFFLGAVPEQAKAPFEAMLEARARGIHERVITMDTHDDINPANSQSIRDYCRERSIPVVGEIPFERKVNQALVACKSVLDFDCGSVSATVTRMWDNTWERLDLR